MPIAFMCAIPHDQSSNLLKYIEPYIDVSGRLIMSMETSSNSHTQTEGQHFHFFADMEETQYKNFSTKYFVRHYKLKGKAKDTARQYGKVKEIRDEDRMISYTLKSKDLNNIYFRNFDLKTIKQYMQESFVKESKKDFKTELMTYLCANRDNFYPEGSDDCLTYHERLNFREIEKYVIQYYINKEIQKPVSRSQVKSWTTTFLMYYLNADIQDIHFYIMR